MTDDKTQRERDLDAARELLTRLGDAYAEHCNSTPGCSVCAEERERIVADAIAEAREHGRRDSDALRVALTDIATPRASADMADPEADQQRDALHALAMARETARKAIAGTEPPRTYEDGLREAARLARKEAESIMLGVNVYAPHNDRADMAIDRLADLADELESLAASTPPATPPEQPRSAAPPGDTLRAAVNEALRVLECGEDMSWCFTRATKQPACDCDNCKTWRRLGAALDATVPERSPEVAPPGDARRLLQDLVNAMRGRQAPKRVLAAWDAANAWLMSLPAGTPEAPPRTAAAGEHVLLDDDALRFLYVVIERAGGVIRVTRAEIEGVESGVMFTTSRDEDGALTMRSGAASRAKGGG